MDLLAGATFASSATSFGFSSAALLAYLNKEITTGNQEAVLLIRRNGDNAGDNVVFYSKDSTGTSGVTPGQEPRLTFTVPEPATAVLGSLSLLAAVLRRRR